MDKLISTNPAVIETLTVSNKTLLNDTVMISGDLNCNNLIITGTLTVLGDINLYGRINYFGGNN
jgi:cytoskeletal protein CcmA (bactofilin family)